MWVVVKIRVPFWGLYRDNGKENGNNYHGLYRGHIGFNTRYMGGCQNYGPFLGS